MAALARRGRHAGAAPAQPAAVSRPRRRHRVSVAGPAHATSSHQDHRRPARSRCTPAGALVGGWRCGGARSRTWDRADITVLARRASRPRDRAVRFSRSRRPLQDWTVTAAAAGQPCRAREPPLRGVRTRLRAGLGAVMATCQQRLTTVTGFVHGPTRCGRFDERVTCVRSSWPRGRGAALAELDRGACAGPWDLPTVEPTPRRDRASTMRWTSPSGGSRTDASWCSRSTAASTTTSSRRRPTDGGSATLRVRPARAQLLGVRAAPSPRGRGVGPDRPAVFRSSGDESCGRSLEHGGRSGTDPSAGEAVEPVAGVAEARGRCSPSR